MSLSLLMDITALLTTEYFKKGIQMKEKHKSENKSNGEIDNMMVIPTTTTGESLFSRSPKKAMEEMKELVQIIAKQCVGPNFIAEIKNKRYPKVEWWTTMGATLGLFPVVIYSRRLEREDEIAYEARVEVRHGNAVIAAGEALCSNTEPTWKDSPEYGIKSMSITRATGKAYRIPLSFLAVMSGLAPTNAEEIPFENRPSKSQEISSSASIKQLDYILKLAIDLYGNDAYRRIGLHISITYGKTSGKELSKTEASEIIESLMNGEDLKLPEDE